MKRKLSAALLTIVMLCMCFCGSAFAAKKPSIEIITMQVNWEDNYVCDPTIYSRNNTNKTMKYVDFYATAYNPFIYVKDKQLKGTDPETNGSDAFPTFRQFVFGVNLTF